MADYNPRYRDESAEYDVNYGKPGNYSYEQNHPAQHGMYNQSYAKDNYNRPPPPYGRAPYEGGGKGNRYNDPPLDSGQYRGDPRNRYPSAPGQYDYPVNNRYRSEPNYPPPDHREPYYRGRGYPRGRPYNPTERPPYSGYQQRPPYPSGDYRHEDAEEPPITLPPVAELFSSLGQDSDIADGLDDAIAIASQGGIANLKRLFVPHAGNSSIHELTTTFAMYGPLEVAPKKKGSVAYITYMNPDDAVKAIRGERMRGFCARPAIAKHSRHSQVLKEYREQAELVFPSLAHSAGPLSSIGQKRSRPETKVATLPPPPRFHVRILHSLTLPPDPFFSIQKRLSERGVQVEKVLLQPPFPPKQTVPLTQEEFAGSNLVAAIYVSDDPSHVAVTFAPDAAAAYPGTPGAPGPNEPLINLFLPADVVSSMILDTTNAMNDQPSSSYRPHGAPVKAPRPVSGRPMPPVPSPAPWNAPPPPATSAPPGPVYAPTQTGQSAYTAPSYSRYTAPPPPETTAPQTASTTSTDPRLQPPPTTATRPMDPRSVGIKAPEPEAYDPEAVTDDGEDDRKGSTASDTGKASDDKSSEKKEEEKQKNSAASPVSIGSSVSKLLARIRTI